MRSGYRPIGCCKTRSATSQAPGRATAAGGVPLLCQLSLPSRLMDKAATRGGQEPAPAKAGVEWHPGELYPRVGFIVTNLARPVERLVAFYNHRGTCEQYIKEGKGAVKWTRLSCRSFAASSSTRWLQSRQFHADAGDAEDRGAVVADQPAREADQDRR